MAENYEKQIIELQNKVIEYEKNKIKENGKIDDISERADFYENLHNDEQRKLYELEMKYADCKLELQYKIQDVERLNAEINEFKERNILDEFDGRTLLKMSIKKLWKKIMRK